MVNAGLRTRHSDISSFFGTHCYNFKAHLLLHEYIGREFLQHGFFNCWMQLAFANQYKGRNAFNTECHTEIYGLQSKLLT